MRYIKPIRNYYTAGLCFILFLFLLRPISAKEHPHPSATPTAAPTQTQQSPTPQVSPTSGPSITPFSTPTSIVTQTPTPRPTHFPTSTPKPTHVYPTEPQHEPHSDPPRQEHQTNNASVLAASTQDPTPTPEKKITLFNKPIVFPFSSIFTKPLGQSYDESVFPQNEKKDLIDYGILFLALGTFTLVEPFITSFIANTFKKRSVNTAV